MNSVVKFPFEVAWHQLDTAENVFHRAGIECWKVGGSPLVQHGNAIPLHEAVRGEREIGSNVLKNTRETSM